MWLHCCHANLPWTFTYKYCHNHPPGSYRNPWMISNCVARVFWNFTFRGGSGIFSKLISIHVNPERSFGETNVEPPSELRKGGREGSSPGKFKKPTLQMVQSTLFLQELYLWILLAYIVIKLAKLFQVFFTIIIYRLIVGVIALICRCVIRNCVRSRANFSVGHFA